MTTATQTAPTTETADRFRCESEVPDPPSDPAGRKQYWEDTVAEAVAELRRRLASTRDEKSFQALQMILDLEKTRLRHKTPVAGTEVAGGYSSPLPPLEQKSEPEASATVLPVARPPTLPAPTAPDAPSPTEPDAPSLTLPARIEPDAPSLTLPARTPPPSHGRYRHVQYPLDAPINTMTDDEYNAYRKWQGYWPGVPPGWPNWPPKPVAAAPVPH